MRWGKYFGEFDGDASIPLIAASALANCCKQLISIYGNTLPPLTEPRAPNMKRENIQDTCHDMLVHAWKAIPPEQALT